MLRGQKRQIKEARHRIDTNLRCSIHNRFDIEVVDHVTGEIKQRAQAENVICNKLWTRLLSSNVYFTHIFYGTGSGTPSATDEALFTHLGYGAVSTVDDVYTINKEEGYCSITRKIQLSETTAVGSILTEVGIAYGTTNTNLVTHAMLKDMNGNQISIEKTNTDIINIYATVFVHWNLSGYSDGKIAIKCIDLQNLGAYGLFTFLLGISTAGLLANTNNGYRFWLTPGWNGIFRGGSGALVGDTIAGNGFECTPTITCDPTEKTITFTAARLPVASGNNIGGIKTALIGAYVYGYSNWSSMTTTATFIPIIQMDLDSTTIVGEALGTGDGIKKDFVTAFSFAHDAVVYVNGVQSNDVTIENIPNKLTKMDLYFRLLDATNWAPPVVNAYAGNGSYNTRTPGQTIYYNPNWALGVASFTKHETAFRLYLSDDLETWTEVVGTTIPVGLQYSKYWKLESTLTANTTGSSDGIKYLISPRTDINNVHFNNPPAEGDVLTINYITDTIAKDVNHVFDFSCTITLGEKTS